jgi:hypothetical protein
MKSRQVLSLLALLLASSAGTSDHRTEPSTIAFHPKPTAPIGIDWELANPPVVAQPLAITLTIVSEIEVSGARLTLSVDDPIVLIEPAAETALGTLVPGEPVAVVVRVLPLVAETQHLRVAVTGEGNGAPQLRSLSVPIRFENPPPDKDATPLSLHPAEAVQSLQAVETVY